MANTIRFFQGSSVSVGSSTLAVTIGNETFRVDKETVKKSSVCFRNVINNGCTEIATALPASFYRDFLSHMVARTEHFACKITEKFLCFYIRRDTVEEIATIARTEGLFVLLEATQKYIRERPPEGYPQEPYRNLANITVDEMRFVIERFGNEIYEIIVDVTIDEQFMQDLSNCTRLESLHFRHTHFQYHNDNAVIRMCGKRDTLVHGFEESVRSFAEKLTCNNRTLTKMSYEGDDVASLFVVTEIAKRAHSLTELGFACYENANFDDNVLSSIAEGCPNLKVLNLGRSIEECSAYRFGITDASLIAIAHKCKKLEHLTLCPVPKTTSNAILAFAHGKQKLRSFVMCGFNNHYPMAIDRFLELQTKVETLDVYENSEYRSRDDMLETLKKVPAGSQLKSLRIGVGANNRLLIDEPYEEVSSIDYSDRIAILRRKLSQELALLILYKGANGLECLQIHPNKGVHLYRVSFNQNMN